MTKKNQKLESKNKKQRALKVNVFDALVDNFEEFKKKKQYVLNILSCYILPSMFKDVQAKTRESE